MLNPSTIRGTFRQIPYWKLRGRFHSCGFRDQEIANAIGIGTDTMSKRMNGKQPWTSTEICMRIKSGVWYWLAMACFVVGLLYGIGVEGTAQTLGTVSDGAFITAMVLILLAIFFMRLGFYAADQEKKRSKKVHQQPRNTVKSGRKAG